jgi:hypothetical protein
MGAETERKQAVRFLQDQMNEADHKIARLHTALEACTECLERNGLESSLHDAQIGHDILHDLLMNQLGEQALSLDALILQQVEHARRDSSRLSENWQRGQATPPAYWDAQLKQGFLTDLLRRFHAWQDQRPYYVPDSEPASSFASPEPDQPGAATDEAAQTLRADIFAALRHAGLPFDHVRLTIQPGGVISVTGSVHNTDERAQTLKKIAGVKGVRSVQADLHVIDAAQCPVCQSDHPA